MSVIDSLRVAGAMARISVPILVDVVRGGLVREDVDEKARWFGQAVLEIADERDAGNGPAMNHYRALRAKYEDAAWYPWIPVPPDPPPPP